jgi:hypothetical protein
LRLLPLRVPENRAAKTLNKKAMDFLTHGL